MTFLYNKKSYQSRRIELRLNMTQSENHLWYSIRGEQLGIKFRRQFSIGRYIVDFYAPRIKLAIEIDGDSHFDELGKKKDLLRDQSLTSKGIRVLRFTNLEISENIKGVLETILQMCQQSPLTFLPPLNLPLTKGEKKRGSERGRRQRGSK